MEKRKTTVIVKVSNLKVRTKSLQHLDDHTNMATGSLVNQKLLVTSLSMLQYCINVQNCVINR